MKPYLTQGPLLVKCATIYSIVYISGRLTSELICSSDSGDAYLICMYQLNQLSMHLST